MKKAKPLIMSFVAIAVLGVDASARAQDNTTPPPESSPPPATHSSGGSSNSISLGGGAGIGVGAAVTLSNTGALGPAGQFVYDASMCHIEALLGFASQEVGGGNDRATEYVFGAGGWYHLHRGASSDFSVGALIAIDTTSGPGAS